MKKVMKEATKQGIIVKALYLLQKEDDSKPYDYEDIVNKALELGYPRDDVLYAARIKGILESSHASIVKYDRFCENNRYEGQFYFDEYSFDFLKGIIEVGRNKK